MRLTIKTPQSDVHTTIKDAIYHRPTDTLAAKLEIINPVGIRTFYSPTAGVVYEVWDGSVCLHTLQKAGISALTPDEQYARYKHATGASATRIYGGERQVTKKFLQWLDEQIAAEGGTPE